MADNALTILGFGILRPFQRDQKNDFATGSGARIFAARIGQILGTKSDTPMSVGELPWRTNFGSRLHILRHLKNSESLEQLAHAYVVEALKRWEPSIVVSDTRIDRTTIPRTLIIVVKYNVIDRTGQTTLENQETRVPLGEVVG